jgi:hypothetical protein
MQRIKVTARRNPALRNTPKMDYTVSRIRVAAVPAKTPITVGFDRYRKIELALKTYTPTRAAFRQGFVESSART